MADKTLLSIPFSYANLGGFLLPGTTSIGLVVASQVLFIYTLAVSILQYFYTQGNIFDVVDNLECSCALFQAYCKLCFFIYYKHKIFHLMRLQSQFLSADNCSKITKKNAMTIKNTLRVIQKLFLVATNATAIGIMIPTAVLTKHLPIGIWKFSDHQNWFWLSFVIYGLTLILATTIAPACDTLLMGFMYEVIIQFKILCDHLEKLDFKNIDSNEAMMQLYEDFKGYIKYHNYLLKFVNDLKDCYAPIFMVQFLTSAPIICSEMYVTFESSSITKRLQRVVTGLQVIAQLAFYCIPADMMVHEMQNVSNAVYKSNWYAKHFKGLKKSTQFIIQRGQQNVRITAFNGVVEMNCITLLTVVRVSFSICTLLRNMQ